MKNYSDRPAYEICNFNSEIRRKWEKERKPYAAFIELTPRCNFNCVHCYLQDHHRAEELSYEKIIGIIDLLHKKGILFLTFSGGEIFLREDFAEIYLYAKKKGFIIELFSNGSLIDDRTLEILSQYPPLLIDISLYGAKEETYKAVTGRGGMFEKVTENIKKLIQKNIRTSLKSPILQATKDEVNDMRKIAKSMGVPFATSYEISRTIDGDNKTQKYQLTVADMLLLEFEEYMENEKNVEEDEYVPTRNLFICNVAQGSFVIDYAGRLCPCMKFRHRGQMLEDKSFDDVWKEFGSLHQMKAGEINPCVNCESRYYCDFCPAEREFVLGSLEKIDTEICAYAKARQAFYKKSYSAEQAIALYRKLKQKAEKDMSVNGEGAMYKRNGK